MVVMIIDGAGDDDGGSNDDDGDDDGSDGDDGDDGGSDDDDDGDDDGSDDDDGGSDDDDGDDDDGSDGDDDGSDGDDSEDSDNDGVDSSNDNMDDDDDHVVDEPGEGKRKGRNNNRNSIILIQVTKVTIKQPNHLFHSFPHIKLLHDNITANDLLNTQRRQTLRTKLRGFNVIMHQFKLRHLRHANLHFSTQTTVRYEFLKKFLHVCKRMKEN